MNATEDNLSPRAESEFAASGGSARTYFFGVISASHKGHFLYDKNGNAVWNEVGTGIPFRYTILDGGLLPPHQPETQGRPHLAVINGWTVLGMWDRTADSRGACNASFIAEGVHTLEEMKTIAARDFPALWARVQNDQDQR